MQQQIAAPGPSVRKRRKIVTSSDSIQCKPKKTRKGVQSQQEAVIPSLQTRKGTKTNKVFSKADSTIARPIAASELTAPAVPISKRQESGKNPHGPHAPRSREALEFADAHQATLDFASHAAPPLNSASDALSDGALLLRRGTASGSSDKHAPASAAEEVQIFVNSGAPSLAELDGRPGSLRPAKKHKGREAPTLTGTGAAYSTVAATATPARRGRSAGFTAAAAGSHPLPQSRAPRSTCGQGSTGRKASQKAMAKPTIRAVPVVLGKSPQRPSGVASDQPPRSRRPAQHGSTSCTPGKEDGLAAASHEPFCRRRHGQQARSSAAVLERNTAGVDLRLALAADAHVPVQTRAAHCKATTAGRLVNLTGVRCCSADSATAIAEQQATKGCPNTCTKRQAKRKMARYSSKAQMSDACVDASTDLPSAALTVLELPNIATSTAPKGKRRYQG